MAGLNYFQLPSKTFTKRILLRSYNWRQVPEVKLSPTAQSQVSGTDPAPGPGWMGPFLVLKPRLGAQAQPVPQF